jgi:Mn2+/Fe2+ NRAMP family transporter
VKGAPTGAEATREDGLISRLQLRYILAAFWVFGALLQLQPYWWQPGQISGVISDMVGQGGLNAFLVDPVLQGLSQLTTSAEIPLNIALIVIFLAIGIALFFARGNGLRAALVASIVVSLLLWYFAEGFGMIFTGMATDFNSGLLLVVIALACWPTKSAFRAARARYSRKTSQEERSAQMA